MFNNANTVFTIDASGDLYDIATDDIASAPTGNDPAQFSFFSEDALNNDDDYYECSCDISGPAFEISCNCFGPTVFQTDFDGFLYIDEQVDNGYNALTLLAVPVVD